MVKIKENEKEFIENYDNTHLVKFEELSEVKQYSILRQAYYENKMPLRESFDNSGNVNTGKLITIGIGICVAVGIITAIVRR